MKKNFLKVVFMNALVFAVFTQFAFSQTVAEGKKAPDFSITTSEGKKVKLSDYNGKALLLHFWATWCPPCRKELPTIETFAKKTEDANSRISFFAICISDSEKNRAAFMKRNKYTFPCALDESGDIAYKYGVQGIPTSILISPDGTIEKIHVGMMSRTQLDEFTKRYAK